MKIIKLYQVSIFLLCCICLNACNKSDDTQQESQISTSISSESSMSDDTGTMNHLVLQVTELQRRCASLQDDCTNFRKEVDELSSKCDKKPSYLKLLLGLLVVLLLILSVAVLVLRNRVKKLKEILDQHTRFIEGMKWELSQTSAKNQGNQALQYNKDIKALEIRVELLEKTLGGVKAPVTPQQPTQGKSETSKSEKGYFGAVVKTDPPYFSTLMYSSNGEAIFPVSITGNVASFEPMNLDMLKSFDYMDYAVDVSGVQRGSAKKMTIYKKGRAECKGNKWVIVEKASVVLS